MKEKETQKTTFSEIDYRFRDMELNTNILT